MKNLKNFGKILNKKEQQSIKGSLSAIGKTSFSVTCSFSDGTDWMGTSNDGHTVLMLGQTCLSQGGTPVTNYA